MSSGTTSIRNSWTEIVHCPLRRVNYPCGSPKKTFLIKRATAPLTDVSHWLLMSLNEKLPQTMVNVLEISILTLHHWVLLFLKLAFSVSFNLLGGSSRCRPWYKIHARYGPGCTIYVRLGSERYLRLITFVLTILPSPHPTSAWDQFNDWPRYSHQWPQECYARYSNDDMDRSSHFLRPMAYSEPSWFDILKVDTGGGCNDLLYNGHFFCAALTTIAWAHAKRNPRALPP
ncbi:hypothetical protein BUALT_Bualt01G0220500 [Buddleja alternifolia]|uniref:Uncharacterized protein n=1 Tax=Buddleja alternifolia TaxID=168488 RepID=A0AAV6YDC8_9LAMI|nr:hypothetical protein BUALT_Bualt01G0220500 [Buddleja alternifolia]